MWLEVAHGILPLLFDRDGYEHRPRHLHSKGTTKSVEYVWDYNLRGNTASWSAEVLLDSGKTYRLFGGVITNVADDTAEQAVRLAAEAEIDLLDIDALER